MKQIFAIIGIVLITICTFAQTVNAEVSDKTFSEQAKEQAKKASDKTIQQQADKKARDIQAQEAKELKAKTTVQKKIVTVAGITLHSKYYPNANYRANIDTSDDGFFDKKIISAMNALTNFFFSLTKIVANVVDTSVDKLYSMDVVNQVSDMIANISVQLFHGLNEKFGVLFFTIAVIQIFIIFAVKQNHGEAFRKAMLLFLVIGLGFLWFSNVSYYLKVVNHLSEETQGVIMQSGTSFTADSKEKVVKGEELEGSLSLMRNFYFDLIVERPYLLMNYGTPDKSALIQKDKNRVDKLLSYKDTKEGQKAKEKVISSEIDTKNNPYMSSNYVDYQMAIAFISFLFSILLGIPLVLIAFLNPLISILFVVLALVFAITAILSILPSFSNSLLNTFTKMLAVAFMKCIVGLFILFIYLIVAVMDKLLPPTSIGMYALNIIAVAASIFLLMKYRNELIKLVTGDAITSIDNHIPENMMQNMQLDLPKMDIPEMPKLHMPQFSFGENYPEISDAPNMLEGNNFDALGYERTPQIEMVEVNGEFMSEDDSIRQSVQQESSGTSKYTPSVSIIEHEPIESESPADVPVSPLVLEHPMNHNVDVRSDIKAPHFDASDGDRDNVIDMASFSEDFDRTSQGDYASYDDEYFDSLEAMEPPEPEEGYDGDKNIYQAS
ncbi:CD3337/EF1877 family mobilome membrane protein [Listeria rustica]|uniref:Uncharacterized protein n=1 Tax=Listeria rustica TaxID=2713503 RepID=A0A7W1T4V2_9LIST|nr:hypothetical protein [Listeria rustica]MBA3925537.1 hypothetical protein [Listeria rustica]